MFISVIQYYDYLLQMFKTGRVLMSSMSHSKKAWYLRHVNDEFVKKAQAQHYRSRAAFKLIEIQEKYQIIKNAKKLLDLGSAPGSWSQAAKVISPTLQIAAIDLLPMKELEGVDFYQNDARNSLLHAVLKQKYDKFDVIISDMAPNFSGTLFQTHEEMIELNRLCLELSLRLGSTNASLIMKTVKGDSQKALFWLLQNYFQKVNRFKPKSSRSQSVEHYIVCCNLKKRELKQRQLKNVKNIDLNSVKSKKQLKQQLQFQLEDNSLHKK